MLAHDWNVSPTSYGTHSRSSFTYVMCLSIIFTVASGHKESSSLLSSTLNISKTQSIYN